MPHVCCEGARNPESFESSGSPAHHSPLGGCTFIAGNAAAQTGSPISFAAGVKYSVGNGPRGLAVGDLNRDGKLDLVVTNTTDKNLVVLLGNGDGSFRAPVPYSLGSLGATSLIVAVVANLDSDGKPDVAVLTTFTSNTGGDVLVLSGNGDGSLGAPVTYPTGARPLWMVSRDLNNDGKPDLLVGSSTTPVTLELR